MTAIGTPLNQLLAEHGLVSTFGSDAIDVDDLTEDSREVRPGCIFLARAGAVVDGRDFISAAEAAGATAVLTDAAGAARASGPVIVAEDPASAGAALAHALHGDPSAGMQVAGITGTNGKTTCATLLQHVLNFAGRRCGLLGGVDVDDGASRSPATLTTPPACDIARVLGRMRDNGCVAAAMEVSSQGIATGRLEGTRFAVGVFTNLSGDHLDLHGDMDTYQQCKTQWLHALDGAQRIVNIDDPVGREIKGERISVGAGGDVQFEITAASLDEQRIDLQTPWGRADVVLPLTGAYNAMNAAQVVAAACSMGAPFDLSCGALASAPVPRGRLQPVPGPDGGPRVFVDFAHADGALHAVLSAVRPLVPEGGRLIVVFGCGGDRDASKRPRMAATACAHADVVWLTSDNPRSEDPETILEQMEAGVPVGASSNRQVDRGAAIRAAIAQSGAQDVVVIAGKGHEQVQLLKAGVVEFDDVKVAQAALAEAHGP